MTKKWKVADYDLNDIHDMAKALAMSPLTVAVLVWERVWRKSNKLANGFLVLMSWNMIRFLCRICSVQSIDSITLSNMESAYAVMEIMMSTECPRRVSIYCSFGNAEGMLDSIFLIDKRKVMDLTSPLSIN